MNVYSTKCVGCYSEHYDIWLVVPLTTKDYPNNIIKFRYKAGIFAFWKVGKSGRLLYKLEAVLDD